MIYYGTIAAAVALGGWAALGMFNPKAADWLAFYAAALALYGSVLAGLVQL